VNNHRPAFAIACLAVLGLVTLPVLANHSWGNYHWPRSSNPVSLTLGNNLTGGWGGYLGGAINDWNQSSVLSLKKVKGGASDSNCIPANGDIEVCNDNYGATGWLGVAGLWASSGHITRAYTKVNDYYFNQPQYSTSAWKQLVMCQEVGHDFGLDHQDENFNNANLNTCMDYTSNPESNQHPNQHDYDQLESIYAHLDDSGGGGGCKGAACATVPDGFPMELSGIDGGGRWGKLVWRSKDGHQEVYELDFGRFGKVVTHVLWAMGYEDLNDDEALLFD